jgi:hypothetical protein
MSKPVITVFRDGTQETKDVFAYIYDIRTPDDTTSGIKLSKLSKYDLLHAKFLCKDAPIGTVILYDHLSNAPTYKEATSKENCLDFMIKREADGWQPYVSSFLLDDERPLDHDYNLCELLYQWKHAEKRSEKHAIQDTISTQLSQAAMLVK